MFKRPLAMGERWAIILAGGEGSRLRRWTIDRFGESRPKQYCAFMGRRSMFDHTMGRAVSLVGGRRVVSVIGHGHARYLGSLSEARGYIIEQPVNRDTAPGLFLPLTYVMAYDPEATVLVFPSDHFIRPNDRFLECMDRAASIVEARQDRLVLVSAVPDRPETEYGWIQPGEACGLSDEQARFVMRFHEKPDAETACRFFEEGFLWNTFNMSAKAKALWSMGWGFHPEMMDRFDALRRAIGSPREGEVLASIYRDMPEINFSKGILERISGRAVVLPMTGVEWSDWGQPDRIQETLRRLDVPLPVKPLPAPALSAAAGSALIAA